MTKIARPIVIFLVLACGVVSAQDAREYFKFAKFKYDQGDYEGALKFLDQAIEIDTMYSNAFFLRAEVNYNLKQYYNAITDINHIIRIDNSETTYSGDYFLIRAKAYLALGNLDKAAVDLERSYPLSKNNAEYYYYRAKFYKATNNYLHALTDLDKAIKLNPDNADAYALRAMTKWEYLKPIKGSDTYESILSDINVALVLDRDNYEYYQIRSDFLYAMGEKEKALEDYNKMVDIAPSKEMAYTKRGLIKMNNYDFRGAIEDFTKSISLNPDDEQNYRYRGLCFNNLNIFSRAYKDFTRAIEIMDAWLKTTGEEYPVKNKLAETYLLRGHCLNLMGNNAQACRDFLLAHNLGVKKGLNYYRKYCGIY